MTDVTLMSPRTTVILRVHDKIRADFPDAKIVIFSKYLMYLDMLDELFGRRSSFKIFRFDDTKASDEREHIKESYSNARAGATMLITPGAGGAGMNLVSASHVIQCEIWWNGKEERQAISRVYCQKQKKEVHVWVFHAVDSVIDAVMIKTRDSKRVLNESIMRPLRRRNEVPPDIPYIGR
ncbi:MAG: hypothetical protein Q9198_003268 [Flavoplaca austrocitrina]